MNRAEQRRAFDMPTRLALVETDLDQHDQGFQALADEIKAVKNVLVGILISVVVATITGGLAALTG